MTRRASSHHAAMFFDDLSRQFLPTLAQFANALFLRRELFALFRDNFRLGPGDEVLVAQLSLQPGNLLLRLGVKRFLVCLWPRSNDQSRRGPALFIRLTDAIQVLPDLFSDEGHVGMQQPQALVKHGT